MAVMRIVLFVNKIFNEVASAIRISNNFVFLKYRATCLNTTIHEGLSIPVICGYYFSAGREDNSSENAYHVMVVNTKRAKRNIFGKIA